MCELWGRRRFPATPKEVVQLPERIAPCQRPRSRCCHQGDDSRGTRLPGMTMKRNTDENGACIVDRQSLEVDIACVGFGPAMGGFLTRLNRAWIENPTDPAFESKVAEGLPLQVLCYERADD